MLFKTGISRRWFMKLGLSGFAGMTAQKYGKGKSLEKRNSAVAVSRSSLKRLQAVPTTCRQCQANCGIIAYLDGDRLVQVLGNPEHPDNRGGLCARGIAGINLVNDVERLLHPLKRVGPRGGAKWTRITWDEAYTILADRLRPIESMDGPSRLIVDSGLNDPLLHTFVSGFERRDALWRANETNLCRDAAVSSLTGLPGLEPDIEHSRTIFVFGADPLAHHDHFAGLARRLVNARVEGGARLVTFDVRLSKTAAYSDDWISLKPGTDGLLAMALIRIILDLELVQAENHLKIDSPFIKGLRKHLSRYSMEYVQSETGVPARRLEELARIFTRETPSVALMGGGVCGHEQGFDSARAITLLNILGGSIGRKGGFYHPGAGGDFSSVGGFKPEEPPVFRDLKTLIENGAPPRACLVFLTNPAYSDPGSGNLGKLLKNQDKVPFLAVMDTHLTETAELADLVLPAATYLESWGLETRVSLDRKPLVNLCQPAVDLMADARVLRSPAFNIGKLLERQFKPRGESMEVGNLCLELSRRIGGGFAPRLPYEDTLDYVRKKVSGLEEISRRGGMAYLKKKGFWEGDQPLPLADTLKRFRRFSPLFRSGKAIDFPTYHPQDQSISNVDNEFVLTVYRSNLDSYGTANSKWIREFFHENRLWINSLSARKLGLKNGSRVKVTSETGSLTVRILVTERIHPGSVALAAGLGHTGIGRVARGRAFKSRDRDTGLLWWGKRGNGINPLKIMTGPGLKNTRVTLEKA